MKAVLFDFNGTLYNDTRFHIEAWGTFFEKYHGIKLSREEILRRCIGPGNMDIFLDFFGDALSKEQKKEYSELKENEYRSAARAKPENLLLKNGAEEFLDYLKDNGIPYALATASPIGNVEFYLHEIGLEKWFDYGNIVYDDGNIKGKPAPDFYLAAAEKIGVSTADCLVLEDSMTGIRSAISAGAGRIVVLEGTTPKDRIDGIPEVYATKADFVDMEFYLA